MTTPNDNLISTLKLAGLNESGAKVYLTCLELGPSSAWNIYLKSGLKRPTCYAILESMLADGVVAKTFDGKRTIFSVVRPDELLMAIDNKRNQFKSSLPLFDAVQSSSSEKPRIRLYEGLEGLRQTYMLGLNQPEGSEILVCGSAAVWQAHNEVNQAYIAERIRKNIKLRIVYSDLLVNRSYTKTDKAELRESRFLSKKIFNPKIETEIFSDVVIYIAHSEKEPFATVIESASLAFDERQKFEIIWQVARGNNPG